MSRGSRTFAQQAVSLPNLLTYARILAIPAVLWVMQHDSRDNAFLAAMIFAVAAATDFVDGWLARRMNLVSMIGKFLDPLADKLIVTGALVMLVWLQRVSPWIVFIILAREVIVTTLRVLAIGEGLVIAARALGKYKTAFQMIGIWALLVHYEYPIVPGLLNEPVSFHDIGTGLLYISVVFSLWSAWDYFAGFFRAVGAKAATPEGEGSSRDDGVARTSVPS